MPNLFGEGVGAVVEGKLNDSKYLIADRILAKHDENYMPPQMQKILKKMLSNAGTFYFLEYFLLYLSFTHLSKI